MIYTSYIANLNNLPEDIPKLIITRYFPKSLELKDNEYWRPELSPSKEILLDYKNNNDWCEYIIKFFNYIKNNDKFIDVFIDLIEYAENNDIFLICYEKDYLKCHRYLLAMLIFIKYNIEFREY